MITEEEARSAGQRAATEVNEILKKLAEERGPQFASRVSAITNSAAALAMAKVALEVGNVDPAIKVRTVLGLTKVITDLIAETVMYLPEQERVDTLNIAKSLQALLALHAPQPDKEPAPSEPPSPTKH